MKIVGLIPARGGSRRLPRKNLQKIGDKTLVEIAIERASQSAALAAVWVSTDDSEIAEVAGRAGALVHHRPPALAQDDTEMMAAVRGFVADRAIIPHNAPLECLMLLQPTSPLRTVEQIQEAASIMSQRVWEALVSVSHVAGPDRIYLRGEYGRLLTMSTSDMVAPNGAFYCITGKALAEGKDWWHARAYALNMDRITGLDVDTEADLGEARLLARAL